MASRRHLHYLIAALCLLILCSARQAQAHSGSHGDVAIPTDGLLAPLAQIGALDGSAHSADLDGDGLSNAIETGGWCNAAGCFVTDPLEIDSDHDALTDGEEKLFDTQPLDSHSPGISIKYQDSFHTSQYYPWQVAGNKAIALPTSGRDAAVVRRGSTVIVGGPDTGTLTISKSSSSLTTLTAAREPCAGGWSISIPSASTVGIYYLTVRDGGWSKRLTLYVIFQLPTDQSGAFVDAFLYDPGSRRDSASIGYHEEYRGEAFHEYDHDDLAWIPEGEWITHGYAWDFNTEHYDDFVFADHVMPAISGLTNTWDAANALIQHVDDVTCFGNPRPLGSSWCVLNPSYCGPDYDNRNQCTNIANLVVAFSRAAGIPARPVWVDWRHATFDHSTEIWTPCTSGGASSWYVGRGYTVNEYYEAESNHCSSPYYSGGYVALRSTRNWYSSSSAQGVHAAGANWAWSDLNAEGFRLASWDLDKSARTAKIVKRYWWETRFVAYWGWPAEPQVTGSPPGDWPAPPSRSTDNSIPDPQPLTATPVDTAVPAIQFGPVLADHGLDLDGDGRYDQLAFQIQVDVTQANRYWFRGQLTGARAEAVGDVYLEQGRHTIELPFGGREIYVNKTDGPYLLQSLWATAVEMPTPTDWADNSLAHASPGYATRAYRYAEFGVAGATLAGPIAHRAVDTDDDGQADALIMETELDMARPGDYTVHGVLSFDGVQAPIVATWTGSSARVTLQFPGLRDTVGPYALLGLRVSDSSGQVTDGLHDPFVIDAIPAFSTSPILLGYQAISVADPTLMQPSFAIINTGYSDAGVDGDGDGLFEQLVINVAVQVAPSEANQAYRLEGWLADSNGNLAAWTIGEPRVLGGGLQSLSLAFDGRILNERGMDGRYTLISLKALPANAYVVLSKLDVAYTTSAYDHDQFETASIPPLANAFADSMEGGVNEWTASTAWSLVDSVWFSYSHAWRASASGTRTGSLSRALDLSQVARPALRLKTCYAMQSTSDRGYVEVSADGVSWTQVITYTGSTANWTTVLLDLSPWGKVPTLRLRFRAVSQMGLRWAVDDLRLDGWPPLTYVGFAYRPQPPPPGADVTFTASYQPVHAAPPIVYVWAFGDGTAAVVSSTPTVVHRFASAGTYTVQLAVENPYDRQVATQPVAVYRPLLSTSFVPAPALPMPGEIVLFSAGFAPVNATQPVTYAWDFGDGSPPVVTSNSVTSHAFASAGVYAITLTASNGFGSPVGYSYPLLVWRHRLFLPVTWR